MAEDASQRFSWSSPDLFHIIKEVHGGRCLDTVLLIRLMICHNGLLIKTHSTIEKHEFGKLEIYVQISTVLNCFALWLLGTWDVICRGFNLI